MRRIYITGDSLGPANFIDAHSINYRRVTTDTVARMLAAPAIMRVSMREIAEFLSKIFDNKEYLNIEVAPTPHRLRNCDVVIHVLHRSISGRPTIEFWTIRAF